jgi:hypothetical protein
LDDIENLEAIVPAPIIVVEAEGALFTEPVIETAAAIDDCCCCW